MVSMATKHARLHAERVAAGTETDAIDRRVTELYTKVSCPRVELALLAPQQLRDELNRFGGRSCISSILDCYAPNWSRVRILPKSPDAS